MQQPTIVRFENITNQSFDVVIHYKRQWEASYFVRDFFADENNHVEYQWSDFDCNHCYRVSVA